MLYCQSLLWLSDYFFLFFDFEKQMTTQTFAIADHVENILGYDILKGKDRQLPNGNVWSFGPTKTPYSKFSGTKKKNLLKISPVLPASAVTNIKQYPVPLAAKEGVDELIKNLEQRGNMFRTHSP